MSETTQVCTCDGSGALHRTTTETRGDRTMTTHTTQPCPCRSALEPREGRAQWWSLETVWTKTCHIVVDPITVAVRVEVPMSAENYRVHRYGNRYYPTMVELGSHSLLASDALALGQALIEAATHAAAIDAADADPKCGHWAPCSCENASQPS